MQRAKGLVLNSVRDCRPWISRTARAHFPLIFGIIFSEASGAEMLQRIGDVIDLVGLRQQIDEK
jgi:hypothetical protein